MLCRDCGNFHSLGSGILTRAMGVEPPEGSIQNGRTRLILRPTGSGGVVRAEITFNGNGTAAARYLGWAPAPAEARLSDPTGAAGPVTV